MNKYIIELKEIFRTVFKRKWWFISAFIFIAAIGLFLLFQKPVEYRSSAVLDLEEPYHNDLVYLYYPESSEELGIYPFTTAKEGLKNIRLKALYLKMNEEIIFEQAAEKINLTTPEMVNYVEVSIDGVNKSIRVEAIDQDPETAFKINQAYLESFLEYNQKATEDAYNQLLAQIDSDIMEAGQSSSPTSPQDLSRIYYILEQNEDLVKNQIIVLNEPNIPQEPMQKGVATNIAIILIIALGLGVIVAYLPDVFINLKHQK